MFESIYIIKYNVYDKKIKYCIYRGAGSGKMDPQFFINAQPELIMKSIIPVVMTGIVAIHMVK